MPVNAAKKIMFQGLRLTLFTMLVITALYVSVGRIATSALGKMQDEIVTLINNSTGLDLSIGQLQGSWSYVNPKVNVSRLLIGGASAPAILVENVAFEFSTFLSLLERSPVFTEITIDGLSLTVEERSKGVWRVKGLPEGDGNFNFKLLLNSAAHIEALSLNKLDMKLVSTRASYRVTNEDARPLQIIKDDDQRTVSLPLTIEKILGATTLEQNKMQILGTYTGDFREAKGLAANLYIQVQNIQLVDFIPTMKIRDYQLVSADVGGEIWLNFHDSEFDVVAKINSPQVKLSRADKEVNLLEDANLTIRVLGSTIDQKVQMKLSEAGAMFAGEFFSLTDVDLAAEHSENGYLVAGRLSEVDIGEILESISNVDYEAGILSDRAREALVKMKPRGLLKDIAFYVDSSAEEPDMKLVSSIRGVRLDAYLGSPGISNLDGLVSLSAERGYIDIDNHSYSMQFASMFEMGWPFDSARGRLNYFYKEGVLQFNSGLLELIKGDLSAYGKLHINLPPVREDQTWGLVIGIEDGDLVDAYRYLPKTLSPDFLSWIKGAVHVGRVEEAALLFHGSLFRDAPKIRKVYELYLDINGTTLDYQEEWPKVSNLDALVYVNNNGVSSIGATGTMLGSEVTNAVVTVPMPPAGQIDSVHISGSFQGPVSDGIRVLNETPLSELTGRLAEQWSGSGSLAGSIKLEVPLGPRSGEATIARVSVLLEGNELVMPRFDLTVSELQGELEYETVTGVSAEQFTGVLLSEPIVGSIYSIQEADSGEVTIEIGGKVDVLDLYNWSNQVLLTSAHGKLEYDAEIHVPFGGVGDKVYVEATSSLKGVEIDMPYPIRKPDLGTEIESYYRQTVMDDGFRIDFSMEEKIQGSLQVENEIVVGGNLNFGESRLAAISYDDVTVTGHLGEVSFEEWDQFLKGMDKGSDVSLESEIVDTLDSINLTVGLLDLYSFEMPDSKLEIVRADSSWEIQLVNRNMSGSMLSPDDDLLPLVVDLEYLRFFEEDSAADGGDPFEDAIPQEMLAVDFTTRELTVEGEEYGSWAFEFRPNATGATFENLMASLKGMEIAEPSSAYWNFTDGVHNSGYSGLVTTQDLGLMLEQWGYASSIEGNDFNFQTDVKWTGSPAMVDMDIVKGSVQVRGKKGRFVQAETGTATLKLLGIFDFNQLGRRLRFDFSDVLDEGYSFDKITGQVSLNKSEMEVTSPMVIQSSGSQFKIGGRANLNSGELDGDMIVTLLVGKNLPWYAAYSAIVTGPLIGASVLLAQKIFENQINQMASSKYKVTGTIDEPDIVFVSFFDDSVRETSAPSQAVKVVKPVELDEI
jgi:uncharacterized protein (TIGR02099 family)